VNLLRLLLLSFRPRRFLSTLNPSMGHIPACQGTAVHLPAARPSNAAYRRYARSASLRSRACGSRSDSRTWISCSQSGPDGCATRGQTRFEGNFKMEAGAIPKPSDTYIPPPKSNISLPTSPSHHLPKIPR
jgi:hypothetical protein